MSTDLLRVSQHFPLFKPGLKRGDYIRLRIRKSKSKPRVVVVVRYQNLVKEWLRKHLGRDDPEAPLFYTKTGKMVRFRGAYAIEVLVYLNTSDFAEEVGDKVFRVKIRDSFTSRDPRSQIDVMEIILDPQVRLISYSWEPLVAKNARRGGSYGLTTTSPRRPTPTSWSSTSPGWSYREAGQLQGGDRESETNNGRCVRAQLSRRASPGTSSSGLPTRT